MGVAQCGLLYLLRVCACVLAVWNSWGNHRCLALKIRQAWPVSQSAETPPGPLWCHLALCVCVCVCVCVCEGLVSSGGAAQEQRVVIVDI